MRKLDVKEIHGYNASAGLELLKPEALAEAARRYSCEVAEREHGEATVSPAPHSGPAPINAPSGHWLLHYPREWLRPDVIAGLTAAAVVLPKALAYATIAGLPVQAGLYTALVPMVVYALLGTSRPLSVSTTTTIAILTGTALGLVVPDGDAGAHGRRRGDAGVLVGLMLLVVATALRLGFVANFISEPVLVGFKSGIGLVIVVDQLPKLFGIHIDKAGFLRDVVSIVQAPARALERHDPALGGDLRRDIRVRALRAASARTAAWPWPRRSPHRCCSGLPSAGVEVIGVVPRGPSGPVVAAVDGHPAALARPPRASR